MKPSSWVSSKKMSVIVLLALTAVLVAWAFHETFVSGTTDGPDFVQILKSGSGSADSISSIEVVEPAVGHTPFTTNEYDSLARRARITDTASISRLLELLKNALSGPIHWNHPGTFDRVYLKANGQNGFFWLDLYVLKDTQRSVLMVMANTCNAVNPNGASAYYLDNYSEVLSLLHYDKATASGHAEKQD
jgi:hypothetical protein